MKQQRQLASHHPFVGNVYPCLLQKYKNLCYLAHGSEVLEVPYTFTWKYNIVSLSPLIIGYPIASWWPTFNEDFNALVFGVYMIENEQNGNKYYQLSEAGIETGHW